MNKKFQAIALILGVSFAAICSTTPAAHADRLNRSSTQALPSMPNMPDVPMYTPSKPKIVSSFETTNTTTNTITRSCLMEVKEPQQKVLEWYKAEMVKNGWKTDNWAEPANAFTATELDPKKGYICTIQVTNADASDPADKTSVSIMFRIMKKLK